MEHSRNMLRQRNIGTVNMGKNNQGQGDTQRNEERGSSCLEKGVGEKVKAH